MQLHTFTNPLLFLSSPELSSASYVQQVDVTAATLITEDAVLFSPAPPAIAVVASKAVVHPENSKTTTYCLSSSGLVVRSDGCSIGYVAC